MSKKNHIDELFRQGLDDKGLAYSGKYWNEMEDLIQRTEKNRSQSYKWYWAGLAFLIFTGGLWLVLANRSEHATTHTTVQDMEVPSEHSTKPNESTGANVGDENPHPVTNERSFVSDHSTVEPYGNHSTIDPSNDHSTIDLSGNHSTIDPSNDHSTIDPSGDLSTVEPSGDLSTIDPSGEHSTIEPTNFIAGTRPAMEGIYVRPVSPSFIPWLTESEYFEMARPRPITGDKSPFLLHPPRMQWFVNPYVNFGLYHYLHRPEVAEWKKGVEEPLHHLGYGLDVRMKKKGISLLTGIGVSRYQVRTNYVSANNRYTFDTSYAMVNRNYIPRPDGSYVALIKENVDTTVHPGDTVLCRDCLTRFTYLNLPLAIQYEFGNNKWTYYGEAGFNFAFYRKTQGEYSTHPGQIATDDFTMVTGNVTPADMAPVLVQFRTSAGVRYSVHRLVTVNGGISYARSLNSMMQNYSQKPVVYGFRVGLEWRLH